MRPTAIAVAVGLAILGLSSCGEGSRDGEGTTSTVTVRQEAPLTKAQFIAKADAMCRAAHDEAAPLEDKLKAIRESASSGDERAQLREVGEVMRQQSELTANEVEEVRTLEPPASDRPTITKMLAQVDAEVSLLEGVATAEEAFNAEKIEVLGEQLKPTESEARGIAQGYGFKVCGSG